jgi:formate dehydrogenase maturation protein FdhE
MYGVAVLYPLVKLAGQAVARSFETAPRTCPECTYPTVAEVARRKTKSKKTIHYWRCSACASRYRSNGVEAPLCRPTDMDWAKHVRIRFPR